MNYWKHPTAIVDDRAIIGDRTKVWHFSHICSGATIGSDCSLGQGVFVSDGAVIGDRCKIQNNVSIYDGVILEEEVFCGPHMVFTNVNNPRAGVSRKNEFQSTVVKKGATLCANCTIVCDVIIGEYSFVGAGAVIATNVKPYALMVGVPARQIGWMSQCGKKLNLPLRGQGKDRCPVTGKLYRLRQDKLIID
jgi:UDP-2-acetamido-3-amino-2,3-dideoxy-glucuronate N-acetyltransferase